MKSYLMINILIKKKISELSFLKTHTHFDLKYIKIAETYDAKIIVSLRDLRDVMIRQGGGTLSI